MDNKLYDFSSLKEACGGDEPFMEKMIDIFLTGVPEDVDKIELALKTMDVLTIKRITHKLKPSINYMCKPDIFDELKEIEKWEEIDEKMTIKTESFLVNISTVLKQIRVFREFPIWE